MFRESLLETSAGSIAQRGWATLMSFGLETVGIGILLLTPMVITQTIPMLDYSQLITPPLAAPRMPKPVITELITNGGGSGSGALVAPLTIPTTINMKPDQERDPGVSEVAPPCVFCVEGGTGDLNATMAGNPIKDWVAKPPVVVPTRDTVQPQVVHISRIEEGMLLSKVEPIYPVIARTARVQGEVLLAAVIGKDGRIQNLRLVSGHPMLARAAFEAVSQWRYRPYVLNGQPVEVDTTIAVKFTFKN